MYRYSNDCCITAYFHNVSKMVWMETDYKALFNLTEFLRNSMTYISALVENVICLTALSRLFSKKILIDRMSLSLSIDIYHSDWYPVWWGWRDRVGRKKVNSERLMVRGGWWEMDEDTQRMMACIAKHLSSLYYMYSPMILHVLYCGTLNPCQLWWYICHSALE